MSSGINWLLNPSKIEIETLAIAERTNDFRAIIDVNDNLYVWPMKDETHFGFRDTFGIDAKAFIYLYPVKGEAAVSSYSHGYGEREAVEGKLKEHPKLKFWKLEV